MSDEEVQTCRRRRSETGKRLGQDFFVVRNQVMHRRTGGFIASADPSRHDELTMNIRAIDHVVLYARDPEQIVRFYVDVLGMHHEVFDGDHHALHFGACKINVHAARRPFEPHAKSTTPGHLDICFTVAGPIESVVDELTHRDVPILEGPGRQVGANGPMTSVYFDDPEGNLIELASYDEGDRSDLR